MKNLDDDIHQLFSNILTLGSKENLVFEDQIYEQGSHFTKLIEKKKHYYLTEKVGILGIRHPLMIKSSLESSLCPSIFANESECLQLQKTLEQFFSQITGIDCYLAPLKESLPTAQFPGRFKNFFSIDDLEYINQNGLCLYNCFPINFSLVPKPSNFTLSNISTYNYLLTSKTLRLLALGQFYDKSQLLEMRSKKLLELAQGNDFIESVEGLTIKLKKDTPLSHLKDISITSDEHVLCFPLYYEDQGAKEVLELIRNKLCL